MMCSLRSQIADYMKRKLLIALVWFIVIIGAASIFVLKDQLASILFPQPPVTPPILISPIENPLPTSTDSLTPKEIENAGFILSLKETKPSDVYKTLNALGSVVIYEGLIASTDTSSYITLNPISTVDRTIVKNNTFKINIDACNGAEAFGLPEEKGEDIVKGTPENFTKLMQSIQLGRKMVFECISENFNLLSLNCDKFTMCAIYK